MLIKMKPVLISSYQFGGAPIYLEINRFLANPVGALRCRGLKVPIDSEPGWRQLAAAIRKLQIANNRSDSPASQVVLTIPVD